MSRRIRLAKSTARELRLQARLLLRTVANRWSKEFPIDAQRAARAKALKQDAAPGILQGSPIATGHHFVLKNIGGRNSVVPALRRQSHLNVVAENANLLSAI